MSTTRTPGWLAGTIVAAVLLGSAGSAWGLGFFLSESKEELKLKYDVAIEDPGTGRVSIVLTLADEGRLKPLDEVQVVVAGKEKNSPKDLIVSIDMVKGDRAGTRVGRVQMLRESAERAEIWLNTHTLDGKLDAMTRLHHVIPIAKYLKDAPVGAARGSGGVAEGRGVGVGPKAGEETRGQPKQQLARTDQEHMIGDWVITNADSKYKTDMSWTITTDRIHRHSNIGGWQMQWYHRLDASKDPRQIDIAGQLNGAPIIKGIYVLDGDELRLCLGDAGKDRPAAFPKKPESGEVTILQRKTPGAENPKSKEAEPSGKPE